MRKILIALALLVGFGVVNQTYAQKAKVLERQPKKACLGEYFGEGLHYCCGFEQYT